MVERTAERPLGPLLAQDVVLLRRKPPLPLGVIENQPVDALRRPGRPGSCELHEHRRAGRQFDECASVHDGSPRPNRFVSAYLSTYQAGNCCRSAAIFGKSLMTIYGWLRWRFCFFCCCLFFFFVVVVVLL